jgi:hypothetical protein
MLTLANTEVYGLERSLIASGNAMTTGPIDTRPNDSDMTKHLNRGEKLGTVKAGEAHDHYLCGIIVQVDIKYPLYWAPESLRYHWFEIITSQSTMHRMTVGLKGDCFNKYVEQEAIDLMTRLLAKYEADKSYENFMRLRSNLPCGYEMWETVTTNYLQLKTMYHQRDHHKLKEDWGAFCDWCDSLPRFKQLTGIGR